MTTPDPSGTAHEIGLVEVWGIPFSTFTRTITSGLHELGVPFVQHAVPPHSSEVNLRSPFGLLPIFRHAPFPLGGVDDQDAQPFEIFETPAIRAYLDREFGALSNESKHGTKSALSPLTPSSARQAAKVDRVVSLVCTQLYQTLEHGVVKPRLAMESNGADEASIGVALEGNLDNLAALLATFEKLTHQDLEASKWIAGTDSPSWADLYVYPPLADLKATPEGSVLAQKAPKLAAWAERMSERPSIAKTWKGTLDSQRSDKGKGRS
ncbi:Glutathione S-transferase [Ceraceosorus bombacis]|uniref:Glutathione S-transferase n=1 Tax=Ceraceosorus bombacis TaxID=401625 RepID=A0A0P1BN53_9BASI|nr:Glutathione S-transferase [Ceraceosorus bombacis]